MTAEDVVMAGISLRAGMSLRERVSVTAVFSVSVRTEISVRERVSVAAWIRLGSFSKTARVFPPSPSITSVPVPSVTKVLFCSVRDGWSRDCPTRDF